LSAAHKRFRLSLLPSGPDEVHRFLLRRTQSKPAKLLKGTRHIITHLRVNFERKIFLFIFLHVKIPFRTPARFARSFSFRKPGRLGAMIPGLKSYLNLLLRIIPFFLLNYQYSVIANVAAAAPIKKYTCFFLLVVMLTIVTRHTWQRCAMS